MITFNKNSKIKSLPDDFFKNTKRVGNSDIIYYDGPLLSLYKMDDKYYLFYWADITEKRHYNTWIVISDNDSKKLLTHIITFMENLCSLNEIFLFPGRQIYLVDIDNNLNYHNTVKINSVLSLPEVYIPSEKYSFFDEELSDSGKDYLNYLKELVKKA